MAVLEVEGGAEDPLATFEEYWACVHHSQGAYAVVAGVVVADLSSNFLHALKVKAGYLASPSKMRFLSLVFATSAD